VNNSIYCFSSKINFPFLSVILIPSLLLYINSSLLYVLPFAVGISDIFSFDVNTTCFPFSSKETVDALLSYVKETIFPSFPSTSSVAVAASLPAGATGIISDVEVSVLADTLSIVTSADEAASSAFCLQAVNQKNDDCYGYYFIHI
jgi:hypothetical protein